MSNLNFDFAENDFSPTGGQDASNKSRTIFWAKPFNWRGQATAKSYPSWSYSFYDFLGPLGTGKQRSQKS